MLNLIESGETEKQEKDMLNEIESGGKADCSLERKAKDNSSIDLPPFLGLFSICSTFAILALSYHMICLLVNNVETLTRHIVATLTQLWRLWRWTTKYLARFCLKLQSRIMRRVSNCTETRNTEDNVTNSQQSPVVVDLVDIVLAAHAS